MAADVDAGQGELGLRLPEESEKGSHSYHNSTPTPRRVISFSSDMLVIVFPEDGPEVVGEPMGKITRSTRSGYLSADCGSRRHSMEERLII